MKKEEIFGLNWADGDQLDLTHVYESMDKYAKQESIDFLEWATGRNLEVSLGVFVDNEGTYDSMEEYYGLYFQSKGLVV